MSNSESFHILVTDINQHVRNFLQRELEKEGYTVHNVKTGSMVWERISGAAEVDLIILDPELFASFDQTFIGRIIRQNSSLQIIIHTYADSLGDINAGENIHLVAKDGQSIGPLKSVIRTCFELFQDRKKY
jgi:CheY-like chemotaxis protein